MTPILAATEVSFMIRGRAIVDEVSVAIEPGRVVIAIGPNGAGKSTLLRLLTGELAPSTGSVRFDGVSLAEHAPWRLACSRAVLPQSVRLALPFTVRETVGLGMDGIGRKLDQRRRSDILESALTIADISHLAERVVPTLSGGEQQRVHFARVLCQLGAGRSVEPRQILFLDEPIASLDLSHQLALLDTVSDLAAQGTAVFAILHDLNLAAAYADDLLVMHRGGLAAKGGAVAVLTDDLLSEVFDLHLRIGAVPPGGQPFILPFRTPPFRPGAGER